MDIIKLLGCRLAELINVSAPTARRLIKFSFLFSFHNISEFFHPPDTAWGNPSNIESLNVFGCTAILIVIFALGFSLAWFMPDWLKKRINKNYQIIEDKEFQEKELFDQIRRELSQQNSIK